MTPNVCDLGERRGGFNGKRERELRFIKIKFYILGEIIFCESDKCKEQMTEMFLYIGIPFKKEFGRGGVKEMQHIHCITGI